jgi:ribosomal protein L3 glutamine methyltransferase
VARGPDRTVRALLELAVDRFEKAGIAYGHGTTNALDEAAWLILSTLGHPPGDLDAHLDDRLDAPRWKAAHDIVERRVRTRKPAAYLLHEAWLGPHRFYVDERVIVPRSFIAELLWGQTTCSERKNDERVPDVLSFGTSGLSPTILDLCTGSGCLAILAALRYPKARVDAADLSTDALAVARRNVDDYALADRIRLIESDLFAALARRRYDLILSNPPYVKASSMRKLPTNTARSRRWRSRAGPTASITRARFSPRRIVT